MYLNILKFVMQQPSITAVTTSADPHVDGNRKLEMLLDGFSPSWA